MSIKRITAVRLSSAIAPAAACVFLLAPGLAAFAQEEDPAPAATNEVAAAEDAAPAAKPDYGPKPHVSARLKMSYDYRSSGDEKDTDLYGYFYGNARDLSKGRADVYVSGRLHKDLDEHDSKSLGDDPYRSVDDSDGVTEDRLLQAYADLHDRDRNWALRAGRQYIDIADYLHVDGAQLMLREDGKLGGRVYAGHPVSYYSSVSGDYAAGVSVIGQPWDGNRTRLTVSQYHDDGEGESDHDYFLDVHEQLTEQSRVRGQLSLLNDEFRMGRADYYYLSDDGETDFSLGGSYWGSFDAKTRAYSPLYNVLGEQDPYTFTYARLTQQVVPHWFVSPGISLRFADQGDNGFNNRDYQNYDVTLIFEPSRAFSASVALEYWTVEDDDEFVGISGELRYRHARVWEVSGGVSFAQYTYDTYSDLSYTANGGQTTISESGTVIEESPYVRTYFLRGKWRVSKWLALRLQGDIEDDDEAADLAYRGRGSIEVRY